MMTQEQVQALPIFKLLTEGEQKWILRYIATEGDTITATKEAFNANGEKNVRSMAKGIVNRPHMTVLINRINGEGDITRNDLLDRLWEIINNSKSDAARVSAAKLYADLKRWTLSPPGGKSSDADDILKRLEE